MPLYVARILYPIEVLGPGKRIGIWFCGCPRRCKGCSNPELWELDERYRTTPRDVYRLVKMISDENPVDGFTVTGGDPMYPPNELSRLIPLLRLISEDILVYSGYRIEEIPREQLEGISVLIDGEYIESRNNNCVLRGSDNQRIHILDSSFEGKYADYMSKAENGIQNFMTSDGVISVGIHRPGFIDDLDCNITKKGINK